MVDLPLPNQPTVLAEAPTERVSARDIAASSSHLANGLKALGTGLEDLSVPIAEQEGRDAVANAPMMRDDNGNLVKATPANSFITGKGGYAYANTVAAGALAEGQNETSTAINDLRVKFMGDPEGFRAAAASYVQNVKQRQGNGPLGASMGQAADQLVTQHYNGMVNQKAAQDVAGAKASILTQIETTNNDLAALARQSGTETHEFEAKSDELNALYDQLKANPNFQMPEAVVEAQRKSSEEYLQGMAIVGHVDAVQKEKGPIAAQKELHDQVNSPELGLSDAQRNTLIAQGQARIAFNLGQNKVEIDANQENFKAMDAAVKAGARFGEDIWQTAIQRSTAIGDVETTARLKSLHLAYPVQAATSGYSPQQSAAAQGVRPGLADRQPSGDYIGNLARQENASGSNTASPGTSSALGKFQFTDGTWVAVRAAHPELGLTADGRTDPAQQDKAIVAHTADNRKILSDAGIEASDKNTYMAHFLGAGGAVKFLQAARTNPNQSAAALFPDAAASNRTVFYNKDGSARTLSEVYALQTGRFSGNSTVLAPPPRSINNVPYTPDQLRDNPFLLSTWVEKIANDAKNQHAMANTLGASIQASLKNNIVPSPDVMANYWQLAQNNPKLAGQAQEIQAATEGMVRGNQALNLTPGQGQAYIDSIKQAAQGGSIYQGQVAQHAKEFYESGLKELKNDPIGAAVSRGWAPRGAPLPLDFNDPQNLAVGLHQRSEIMGSIAARTGDQTNSAIPPTEIDQAKSVLANGSIQQRVNLMAAVSSLPEAQRRATLTQLGQSGEPGRVFAVAGSVQAVAPQVANDIITGYAALQAEPKFGPKASDLTAELGKALPPALYTTETRQAMQSGIEAYYAFLSRDANDLTGALNSKRLDTAVQAVTGGVVNMRGNKVIGPWYGATQDNMDAAVRVLTDVDMRNSVTADGSPLPVAALKPSFSGFFTSGNFRLENADAGRYRIYSGADTAKVYVKDKTGQPFLLDLGAKRREAENEASHQWALRWERTPFERGATFANPNPIAEADAR